MEPLRLRLQFTIFPVLPEQSVHLQSFYTLLTHEHIFLGLIALFCITFIPSAFMTRIFYRNPGKFLEKFTKNHIFVDCSSPMDFSEKNAEREKKVKRILRNEKKSILAPILFEIHNFEETCFFRFLPENRYFSNNHIEFVKSMDLRQNYLKMPQSKSNYLQFKPKKNPPGTIDREL